MSKTTNKFAPDVRERAVRMVLDEKSARGLHAVCATQPNNTSLSDRADGARFCHRSSKSP